ncbi:hypothetical protein TNCV_1661401 [Trichonephila clavipes]|nr:hypothetical protein TNCV_1661401 [Trichonephila clavipes]
MIAVGDEPHNFEPPLRDGDNREVTGRQLNEDPFSEIPHHANKKAFSLDKLNLYQPSCMTGLLLLIPADRQRSDQGPRNSS